MFSKVTRTEEIKAPLMNIQFFWDSTPGRLAYYPTGLKSFQSKLFVCLQRKLFTLSVHEVCPLNRPEDGRPVYASVEGLTAALMKTQDFWDVMTCRRVNTSRRFKGLW